MKKTNLIAFLLAFLVLSILPGVMAQGTEKSMPLSTPNGLYTSTLFGYQVQQVVWTPWKQYKMVDYLSVVPSGSVKPGTSYTLVLNSKENTPKNVVCIKDQVSTSTQVKENGKWVTKGYLNFNIQYSWTGLVNDNKNQKFYLVESNKVNCFTGKILSNFNEILSTSAI